MRVWRDECYLDAKLVCDRCKKETEMFQWNAYPRNRHVELIREGWSHLCGHFPDKDYCPDCMKVIFQNEDLTKGSETQTFLDETEERK